MDTPSTNDNFLSRAAKTKIKKKELIFTEGFLCTESEKGVFCTKKIAIVALNNIG